MAAPRAEDVIAFLTERGFSAAAAALRDDLLSRHSPSSCDVVGDLDVGFELPPLRLPPRPTPEGGGEQGALPSATSSDAFVSINSSPSELLNSYGVRSPARGASDDESTDEHSEFGTARDYDNYWYDDQFGESISDPVFARSDSGRLHSEDKFIMPSESEEMFGKQECFGFAASDSEHELDNASAEVYSSRFSVCDCFEKSKMHDNGGVAEMIKISNSATYGRYQILDDHSERLDECGGDEFELKRVDELSEAVASEHNLFHDSNRVEEKECLESGLEGTELQMLVNNAVDDSDCTTSTEQSYIALYECTQHMGDSHDGEVIFVNDIDDEELQKRDCGMPPFEEQASKLDANGIRDCGTVDREIHDSRVSGLEGEDGIDNELGLHNSYEDELEVFNLRIIHRKNRTGFEENKDFPIHLNSVIAGRYYITEYLGSAAFSKVVQAHDLQTGIDVCLKIINNNKDFFDQSLDEIKLLKFVNKHDPADEYHLLRLYDYFYHREHLIIVTELLGANLYEFQKYNRESGGEEYYTLHRIQTIARQCLEALEYLHTLRIIHCDLKPENILIQSCSRCEVKVIDLGSSCFETDNLCLYVQSRSYRAPEVILGLPYDPKIDIWSLGCILAELHTGDVLFPNDSVSMILARMIGILGSIDMEMLALGHETSKYFTENYDLYNRNEETDQVEYLIPERSSLSHHLPAAEAKFIDFLTYLLQINPKRRPTASEALAHEWFSISYQ